MSILARALVRTLVLAAMYVVTMLVAYRSTDPDPLGFGLTLLMLWVGAAFVWGIADGMRHRAAHSLLVWLVVAAAMGLVLILGVAVLGGEDAFDDAVGTIVFCVVLVGVPAAIGIGIGELANRLRS